MRVLVINAPGTLARELQNRANNGDGLQLMIACRTNPLGQVTGSTEFSYFVSRRKVDFGAIVRLRKLIRDFQPDIVHCFLPRSLSQTVLATIGLRRQPKIVSFYGITRVPTWRDPSDWITYLCPMVAMHSCESNAVKHALLQGGIKESKCEVIYNCVEKVWHALPKEQLLAKYDFPRDSFVVGTVASVRPVKGIDILLRALLECAHIPNWVSIIAGPLQDPVVAKLAEHPQLKDRIRWLGYTPNAATLIKGMDLFVMPSRKEGLCRALIEAMEQGVCPIISDAGGMKEIVRDGVDGVVFPREDYKSLAAIIQRMVAAPELISQYGNSALERAEAICSPQVVGERVIRMYERLMTK
ncbi:MAG: glycosyltransferase family 4 protein [Planctomycetota bacterium]|nr:glycosyltransferase family 4 protein [Planctomycetota bacterium]